jgi:hypothetical protein
LGKKMANQLLADNDGQTADLDASTKALSAYIESCQ